jgi:hypothetical protein
MPEEYRKRLEAEAHQYGRSLNQQIIRVLEIYFATAGYPSNQIHSAGQLFEIHSGLAYSTPEETSWEITIENYKTGRVEGRYVIGLHRTLIRDLKISDKEQAAKEVSLAILTAHAKQGRDIRNLNWTQYPDFTGKRLIFGSELDGSIESLPSFLEMLSKGQWDDRMLVPDNEIDAIKTLLLTAKLEGCLIAKHMLSTDGAWLEIGKQKFNGSDRSIYTQALSKMGLLGLVELQTRTETDLHLYKITNEGHQYLLRLAAFST